RRAELFAIGHGFFIADITGNFTGKAMPPDGQPDGTAEQTNPNNSDFLELHARKIADGNGFVNR
ncbi:MAG TPA: hypothetical protein VKJ65_01965, partial [Phycisphaerae bacterium]|nr:hypothetical protein [Phycisphaerae bacterium]